MLIKLISFHEISNFALSIHDNTFALHHLAWNRDDHLHNRKKRSNSVTIAAFYLAPARSHSRFTSVSIERIHAVLQLGAHVTSFSNNDTRNSAYKKATRKSYASRFLSSASSSLSLSFYASDFVRALAICILSVLSRKSEPFQETRLRRMPSVCLYPFRRELSEILGRATIRALTMIKGIRGSLLMEGARARARGYRSITSENADNCIRRKYMDAR